MARALGDLKISKAALGIAVVLVASVSTAASGRAAAPSRIVFTADRAPSLSGEIYRLDPDGTRVDLSSSPFQDAGPVVSPDGRRVAFFSDRSGAVSVWEMGIDGGDPVQVGPPLVNASTWQQDYSFGASFSLAWQPGGQRLASVDGPTLSILQPGQEPLTAFVAATNDELLLGPWSPDGRVVMVWDAGTGVARAFSPDGSRLWSVRNVASPYWAGWSGDVTQSWTWSRGGLLALPVGRVPHPRLRVYDERGRLRFAVRGPLSGRQGWSPNGKRLAVVVGRDPEVFTAAGRLVLRSRSGVPRPGCRQVIWASDRRFIVGGRVPGGHGSCRAIGVALGTGRVSTASSAWFGALSADRKLAAAVVRRGRRVSVGARSTSGDVFKAYGHFRACAPHLPAAPVSSLQFAGSGRSVVYASNCPFPPTILYSVAPDGSGLEKIATSSTEIQRPDLSPDGAEIAYSDGSVIRSLSIDGVKGQLTFPPTACTAPGGDKVPYHDTSPSWSPDGTAIVFTRTDCNSDSELYADKDLGLAGDQATWGLSRIAYLGLTLEASNGVWTANPDGTDPTQVSPNGRDPAWSADGRLAYLTDGNNVVVDSTPVQLPFTDVASLAWSPDGTRFVVAARTTPADPYDVYTVGTDGSDPIQLTQDYDALAVAGWR